MCYKNNIRRIDTNTSRVINAILIVMVALVVSSCKHRQRNIQGKNNSVIELIDSVCDFGTWHGDTVVQHCSMRLRNAGTDSLVIHKVDVSCGCVKIEYPHNPIAPNDTVHLRISYNGKGKIEGHFLKEMVIFSNAKSGLARMKITGNMIRD